MTPHEHSFLVLRRVHERLLRWVGELLQQAGHAAVRVTPALDALDGDTPALVVVPIAASPWPKIGEFAADIPLMAANVDRASGVPEAWAELGQLLDLAVHRIVPPPDPRARGRQVSVLRQESLPPALRAWYAHRPVSGAGEPWVVERDGVPLCRLPSLAWRRPLGVQSVYLVLSSRALLDGGASFSVPALTVVNLAIHLERTLSFPVPPAPVDPSFAGYARALASTLEPEQAARVDAIVAWAHADQEQRVALMPMPETEHLTEMLRSLRQPVQPVASLAIRLSVGGGPVFGPGPSPILSLAPEAR
jgi:hypothetical protein